MGSLRSETSSDTSTDTSTSDSESNASPLLRTSSSTIEATDATAHGTTNGTTNGIAMETDDEESDSDVSMSADSDDDDEDESAKATSSTNPIFGEQPKALIPGLAQSSEEVSSRKRRFSDSTPRTEERTHNGFRNEDRKRLRAVVEGHVSAASPKAPKDKSFLPAEIWHHIFTFCPPRVLGQLLRVNKSFHSSIGISSSNFSVAQPKNSSLKLLSPDEIWRTSRKRFLPGAPGPLTKFSELTMWKLACGNICQFCSKRMAADLNANKDQWHSGPGQNGVSPVWNFGIRTCGSCLKENSLTEFDLLTSSVFPSLLMAALPLVFFTNELHVISTTTLQAGQQPANIQITKLFSKGQVDDIIKEFEGVKTLGSAATEEWLKGLDGLGKARKNDAARWERWEAGGGLLKMRKNDTQDISKSKITLAASLPPKPLGLPPANSFAPHQPPMLTQQIAPTPSYPGQPMPIPTHDTNPPRFDSPVLYGLPQYPPPPRTQSRQIKTKEDVAEIKAARRAEIERRCMGFDPPLTAGVIAHMASFQAALHILKPLDERDWEILKPRLLAQREEAEQRENDRLAQTRVVQERLDERRNQDSQTRADSKDLVDREWEDIQAPLRARISGYADEIIREGWNGGDKVNTESCPLFAAEVLIYVRKRFYAEIAKDDAALRATGRQPEIDPPHGPFTRKLILENMKWVFDTKIKPLTEPHRKELFLCNDCEFITKYYGFEGIIQHFAAKHTNTLSMGSVVVHWKSEWPEHPPFNPDPNGVKPNFGTAPSASVSYANSVPQPMQQQNYGYGGYQPAPLAPVLQTHPSHGYQPSPSPYYGQSQYPPYSGHQNGPFAPPPYPGVSQPYQPTQYSAAPGQNNNGYADYSYNAPYTVPAQGGYEQSQAQTYPTAYDTSTQPEYPTQNGQYGQPYNQPSSYPAPSYPPAPQVTEQYKAQLQQLAHDARDVWDRIQSVKEIPGSVKVCTVIYHILSRFRATYQEDPSLSMLVDGLSNNKDMRPVRNINGLVCKACSQGMPGFVSASNKKHFSFPQLASHFHSLHEEGVSRSGAGAIPDWTKDMVELPDHSKLVLVATAPGMDEHKLKLFAEALPEIIAPSPPVDTSYSNDQQYYPAESEPYTELAPSRDNHANYYTTTDSSKQEAVNTPYDNGEYDPRNPRDIIVDPQSFRKPSLGHSREIESAVDRQPEYRYAREEEEPRRISYQERPDRSYVEPRPISSSQSRYIVDYGRSQVREEAPIYVERPVRYQDEEEIEYRVRQNRPVAYEEPICGTRDYRAEANQGVRSNRQEEQPLSTHEVFRPAESFPAVKEDPTSQQNRIFEVVAQIQQQAKVAQDREHARKENPGAGSEDGEVRAEASQSSARERQPIVEMGDRAAERFLDEFRPERAPQAGINIEGAGTIREQLTAKREGIYHPESERQTRRDYEDDQPSNGRLISTNDRSHDGRMYEGAASRQPQAYAYEDRYVRSDLDQAIPRERSPELVDRRYKLNNVVYRDERQGSARHTPSRYARYESVRLENERERSRSPVYVKMGAQPAPYRERSTEPIYRPRSVVPAAEEPTYRPRSAIQAADGLPYERLPPRQQEYVRVYADEPPRPQYTEIFEYVRVADPAGDYMIRRPVRQPVYERYDERQRQPVYENRGARQEGATTAAAGAYEEYDPRHPETVANVNANAQRARYQ